MDKFLEEKQKFTSQVIADIGDKPIHFALTFVSAQEPTLDFKVHCSCILNENENNCSKFIQKMRKSYEKQLTKTNPALQKITPMAHRNTLTFDF
jgi:uncharacterized protein with gpF-like domain